MAKLTMYAIAMKLMPKNDFDHKQKGKKMDNIKILVACHKPSVLPKNSLFLPVQVGSEIAAKQLENMEHDNNGENISSKNPAYCELTAQYWGWKNVQADYYGLCHYRRFLCFANVDMPKNVRNQYEAGAIDSFNLKKFGLEDETEMRTVIEANDVVVGQLQEVSKLYTPHGNQNTALKHWIAHDRALINIKDLEKMLDLLDGISPAVGKSTREYLNGGKFLGFNCFVMKKALFDEMCAIEFKVLEELEKYVDLSTYNQQLARIFGFMGEIISSGYVYHLEKQKSFKVKHVPLVYFNYTDEIPVYMPILKKNTISVFFDQSNELNFMFGAVWQSFLDHIEQEANYDVFAAVRNITPTLKQVYTGMAKAYPNVTLRFIPVELYEAMMLDQVEISMGLLPFLPWVLPKYDKVLAFGSDILFKKSIRELWNESLDGRLVAAPADILMRARVNDIYKETEEKYLCKQVKNPLHYFCTKAILLDAAGIRNVYDPIDIYKKCWNNENKLRVPSEIMNVLFEGNVKIISQQWSTMYESNDYLKYQLPYAPKADYMQLVAARKSPAIIIYMPRDPWLPQLNEVDIEFWSVAKRLPIYPKYIAYMSYLSAPGLNDDRKIIDKIFPHNSRIRNFLIKVFPNGSIRRKVAKKILHFLKLQ